MNAEVYGIVGAALTVAGTIGAAWLAKRAKDPEAKAAAHQVIVSSAAELVEAQQKVLDNIRLQNMALHDELRVLKDEIATLKDFITKALTHMEALERELSRVGVQPPPRPVDGGPPGTPVPVG